MLADNVCVYSRARVVALKRHANVVAFFVPLDDFTMPKVKGVHLCCSLTLRDCFASMVIRALL